MSLVIELLYCDGCPNHEALLARLPALQAQAGVTMPLVQHRRVASDDAQQEGFLGSPTLRADDADLDPTARKRSDFGLKCRLYPTADGLHGGSPDQRVLDALHRAARATSTA